MRKMLWSKLRFCFGYGGSYGKEINVVKNSSKGKMTSNVNEEYGEAFRTKSYADICNRIQNQLEKPTLLYQLSSTSSSSASSPMMSSPSPALTHLSDSLLEPSQETLISIFENSNNNLPEFLVQYFQISLEASRACEALLQNVNQVRINHHPISKTLRLIKSRPLQPNSLVSRNHKAYRNLAAFALQKNPFSKTTRGKLHEMRDAHVLLLRQLTSQCKKTKRRTKQMRFLQRGLATVLAVGGGTMAMALMILSIQTSIVLGMVAVPGGIILCCLVLIIMKKLKRVERRRRRRRASKTWLEEVDIAAKGVYILINDFDTVSRLVQRLHDELEHRKFVADMCVKKGKNEMLREVAREFEMNASRFAEHLEELEKQIYLCLLDINRSRRLLVEEMFKC